MIFGDSTGAAAIELQGQLETAGVEVVRTQLRRLAYAPEIAADMLRRQQGRRSWPRARGSWPAR